MHYLAMCVPDETAEDALEGEEENPEEDEGDDMEDEEEEGEEEEEEEGEEDEEEEDKPKPKKKGKRAKKEVKVQDKKKLARKAHNARLIKCAEYLLTKGTDINSVGEDGTPLLVSLRSGNKEFSIWLIKKGSTLKGKTQEGETILHMLGQAAKLHSVKSLVDAIKASVDYKSVLCELASAINNLGEGYHILQRT